MKVFVIFIVVVVVLFLSGCKSNGSKGHNVQSQHKVISVNKAKATLKKPGNKAVSKKSNASQVKKKLMAQYREWKNVRYRYGGTSKRGIDCSGFAQKTFFSQFDVLIPRSTTAQSKSGPRIHKKNLQTGDLVFFKTGRSSQHVGIYLDQYRFLHASTSKGVMISDLRNIYWTRKYWKSVRVTLH